jgi:glutamate-5-semialdehyde dehydrogenase
MTLQPAEFKTLKDYMTDVGQAARLAARTLATASPDVKRSALLAIASALETNQDVILSENVKDVEAGITRDLSPAMVDRLRLDPDRLAGIAQSVRAIADQTDPVGAVLESWDRPNGLRLQKVATPIGVIGMIYESRPNVTVDAAALCLRSGNAVILRGGSEAVHSNHALHTAILEGLRAADLPETAVQLLGTQDRDAVGLLLGGLNATVDLIIPRGGKGLVGRVQSDARVPVLAHLDGLNHTYIHKSADTDMAVDVVANAKMRRTGICGSTETVLIDQVVATAILPALADRLLSLGCELRGDEKSQGMDSRLNPATDDDFATEHLSAILNVAIVDGIDAALVHIDRYGSGHTDAIIAEDATTVARFNAEVDSAIVMHNASTQFADGGEFGFGAEIGIATGRLHARGPVGAKHLTTFKYLVSGDGTTRP